MISFLQIQSDINIIDMPKSTLTTINRSLLSKHLPSTFRLTSCCTKSIFGCVTIFTLIKSPIKSLTASQYKLGTCFRCQVVLTLCKRGQLYYSNKSTQSCELARELEILGLSILLQLNFRLMALKTVV